MSYIVLKSKRRASHMPAKCPVTEPQLSEVAFRKELEANQELNGLETGDDDFYQHNIFAIFKLCKCITHQSNNIRKIKLI